MKATKRLMKSEKEIRDICHAEVERELKEQYDNIVRSSVYNSLAVAFCVLARDHGFGRRRLASLKNAIENEFVLMDLGVLGRAYSSNDCCIHLKNKYGIDFNESQYKEAPND